MFSVVKFIDVSLISVSTCSKASCCGLCSCGRYAVTLGEEQAGVVNSMHRDKPPGVAT